MQYRHWTLILDNMGYIWKSKYCNICSIIVKKKIFGSTDDFLIGMKLEFDII